MKRIISKVTLFTIGMLFLFITGYAQEKPVVDSSIYENALSMDQISSETETLQGRIKDLREILKPSTRTLEIDSLIDSVRVKVMLERDTLYSEIETLSRRELKSKEVLWQGFKKDLKSTQSVLNSRNQEVTEISEDLVSELEKWQNTKTILSANTESEEVFASLDTMILTLNQLIDYSHIRLDSLFRIEKNITDLILIIDEGSSEIIRYERQKQKEYFVFDSPPIWERTPTDTLAQDSVLSDSIEEKNSLIITGLQDDCNALKQFVETNISLIVLEIFLIMFSLFLVLYLRGRFNMVDLHLPDDFEKRILTIISNPFSSSLIVGVLVASFFYHSIIPVFSELQILLVFMGTVYLFPRVTHQKIRVLIGLLFIAFLIQTIEPYFEPRSVSVRWLMLVKTLIIMIGIFYGRKVILTNPESFGRLKKVTNFIFPFYGVITILCVIFNAIGMVNLTDILLSGVLLSMSLGAVVFLAVEVIGSLLLLIIQLRKEAHVEGPSIMVEATTKRFQPILVWTGLILWLVFTVKGFDFYDNLMEWFSSMLEIDWKIGDAKISLGSILSFTSLIVVSLLIAKLVASIFQDQWLLKVLPRGVAPATSLVLRIVVISIGVYVAFSAAGFDVSKLGIVFGALSVGIGFGLQNVVLNFIAGLILAFERPINLGDAIEIDNEMGEVTNIGVRSSNIRTYSGAEAIIPNGDLISKKVVNWTLADRDRRSKIRMRTSSKADPNEVIELFNKVASDHPKTFSDPAPKTFFYGYGEDGNLEFALLYWSTFSDTLKANSEIALSIFNELRKAGIEAPIPNQRNFDK